MQGNSSEPWGLSHCSLRSDITHHEQEFKQIKIFAFNVRFSTELDWVGRKDLDGVLRIPLAGRTSRNEMNPTCLDFILPKLPTKVST